MKEVLVWCTGGLVLTGGTEVLGEKPVQRPPWPPPIPQWIAWDRTRSLAVRGRHLAARASLWCHGWKISTWRYASLGCETFWDPLWNECNFSEESEWDAMV